MPLHTDVRPTSFDEMLGNENTIKALKAELAKPARAHCYMFKGESGLGKTTLVRICANMLNASDMDIHELNIGDARGIDNARDIIELMSMMPYGDATVIILDEAHNSTKAFQEALLKPFEDVPSHVYIFMATTEPNKVIKTLRRRFMEFELSPVKDDVLFMYLLTIVKQQNSKVSKDVIDSILEQAHGSVANALMLLDKIISLDKSEQLAVLDEAKNNAKTAIDLCQALLYGKPWNYTITVLKSLEDNPEGLRRIILSYMEKVLMNSSSTKYHLTSANIIAMFSEYTETKAELVMKCYMCSRL